ncbi:MAG TPA: hypothetical protein PLF42_12695 [Anaerolineales bacterium]|nr:hypothetical protein [Anaerolineales bacterium]
MKIVKNDNLIHRNGKIGQWMSFAALGILGLGMYISFTMPELFIWSLVCLAVGFIMTQIGMYLGVRYGRSPRPDEKLDAAMKGLHSEFAIYHYSTPVSHFLVGPAGAWVILPYHQRGRIFFQKNRWRMSGGGFMQAYMRIFGQEGIGRPDIDAENETHVMKKFLVKKLGNDNVPDVKPILVFTSDDVEVDAGESPIPAMKLKQLKELMRQGAKNRALSSQEIAEIRNALPQE